MAQVDHASSAKVTLELILGVVALAWLHALCRDHRLDDDVLACSLKYLEYYY